MSRRNAVLITAALIALAAPVAFAQDARFDPALEDQRERDLRARREAVEEFTPRPDLAPELDDVPRVGPCFEIAEIRVEGADTLPPEELGAIVADYVPGCLQGGDIQDIMQRIDGAYSERGHITTKTYIEPQNVASGTIVLTVVEGKTEGVYLVDQEGLVETKRGERQLRHAFPGVEGRIFQLRDFEQGLDQMNRLRSVDAKLRLQPGEEPGGSNVIVQRLQEDLFRGYLDIDNFGSDATGRTSLGIDLEWDDALGMNDTWSLALSSSEETNALEFGGSIPFGYWTYSLAATYSEYRTPLTEFAELFGKARSFSARATKLINRDQTKLDTISFGLQTRRSRRFVNNERLIPQKLTVVDAGFRRIEQKADGRVSFDVTATLGLDALGANEDRDGINDDEPHAQFIKLEGGWYRQAPVGEIGVLTNDLRLQFAPVSLYSSQQMALGSYGTVRGYDQIQAVGDVGAYIRNDLYLYDGLLTWMGLKDEDKPDFLRGGQHKVFLDAGITYDHARDRWEKVAGLGYGLTWEFKRVFADAFVSVPFVEDNDLDLGDPIIGVQVDVKVF
ncbi:ShlB/FhaC/HecB family hemolysin secretion/activation protein [Palleronia caenipelagi]|uniref:ShlB/FhaC/HecB family hemolysin secretion/activation protein n=1 Tax=Palleronia caenipelagi TaxID=2489174 RepID=A0A547PMJ5_9RHOB|nr:ShlB/FhaC/HecB family hemolysin secretion/activation protein [Palleronia caenipelagi]TRD15368.1 ShlB/FhaC/HecB family hemolysin secretion/activation protein [Palleronia caenipelagi]